MAEDTVKTTTEHQAPSTNKTVQEIAAQIIHQGNGEGEEKFNIPERYIHENGYPSAINFDSDPTWVNSLLVDFSRLSPFSSSSPKTREEELEKLRFALTNWGCFQVMNHGMSSSFLEEFRQVIKQFFALPLEEKQKYARGPNDFDGYGNDSDISSKQTLDWTDRLYLSVYPEKDRKLGYWPQKPQRLREIIDEFCATLRSMFEILLKAMAHSLHLDDDQIFLNEHGIDQDSVHARFNFYPICPSPHQTLGVKPHADGTTMTFLLQDEEVEGLQVLKDGQWYKVPIIPGAIFINAGDLTEIISNGVFKSAVHRVVTNSDKERISLAVFFFPRSDKVVTPIKELVTDDRPQMYQQVTNYTDIFFKHYQLGQRPLDAVRIAQPPSSS